MADKTINPNYLIQHSQRVLRYLDRPDLDAQQRPIPKIKRVFFHFIKNIQRLWNLLFGDHHWYNNAKGRAVVLHYLNNAQAQVLVGNDTTILKIFQRLEKLQHKNGTYADGISASLVKKLTSPKEVSSKLLFHIHGDEFGQNSELEGSKASETLGYLFKFIREHKKQKISTYGTDDKLLEDLYIGYRLAEKMENSSKAEFITEGTQLLKQRLAEKRPLLLPGGWIGSPSGHAMAYELIPEDNQKATLRIYNLGSGVEAFHSQQLHHGKQKASPYVEWKGISTDNLLRPSFLEALYETQTIVDHQGHATGFSPNDIYEGIKALLNPEKVEKAPPDKLMTGQRAGICAWRSFMPFMQSRMSAENYKSFKLDIELQSLAEKISTTATPTISEWRLIQKSHEKICRKVERRLKNTPAAASEIDKIEFYLKPVRAFLKKNHPIAAKTPVALDATFRAPVQALTKPLLDPKTTLNNQLTSKVESVASQPGYQTLLAFRKLLNSPAVSLYDKIFQAEKLCEEALSKAEYQALELGMVEFMRKLLLDKSAWEKECQDPQKTKALIAKLGSISHHFFKNCFLVPNATAIHPKRLFVLRKLQFLQMGLAALAHPGWGKVRPSYFYPNDLCFSFFNPEMDVELKEMEREWFGYNYDYFQIYFSRHLGAAVGESTRISFSDKGRNKNDFMETIQKVAPEAEVELRKGDPNFAQFPPFKQRALIFTSDKLPDWVKAIRDTEMQIDQLMHEPVGTPTTKKGSFGIRYTLGNEEKERCEVGISVEGIDGTLLDEYPELKASRENQKLRFTGLHRPWSNQALKTCFKEMQEDSKSEKKLVVKSAKDFKIEMADEQFKELLHLVSEDGTSLEESLAYFRQYPDKISDPDYQALFKMLFLRSQNRVHLNKDIAAKLAAFIEQQYQHFRGQNELQPCAFLLEMVRYLGDSQFVTDDYFNQSLPEKPFQPFYQQGLLELRQLLKRPSLEPEEKSVLNAELMAYLSNQKALTQDEVVELLTARNYLHSNPIPSKWIDPEREKCANEGMIIHAETILNTLAPQENPNQNLLNQLLKASLPAEAAQTWQIKTHANQMELITKDGRLRLAPLTGELYLQNQKVRLPLEIREHPLFRKLFAGIEQGSLLANNIYSFKDASGREVLLKLEDNELMVEQKQGTRWLKYIPSATLLEKIKDQIHSKLSSRQLLEYSLWIDTKDPTTLLLFDPKTGQESFQVKIKNNEISEIRRSSDKALLGTSPGTLDHFEDPAFVHYWFNEQQQLKEIELPRFGLSFTWDQKSKQLSSTQFPGHFLDISAREPYLGVFEHHLVLKSAAGNKEVLLPKQKLDAKPKKEVLAPHYEILRQIALEDHAPQQFYTFKVNAKQALEANSREANLYLAYALSAAQQYEGAAALLLKQAPKLSLYSIKEAEILRQIVSLGDVTGDMSGNGLALRTFAGYSLLKNALTHQKQVDPELLDDLKEAFKALLQHQEHATALKLEEEEELILLKVLLDGAFDPLLFVRLKSLDPAYAQRIQLPNETPEIILPKKDPLAAFALPFSYASAKPPEEVLLTRPRNALENYFQHYYTIARQGKPEEKERLREMLLFLRHGSPDNVAWGLFFETVLNNPTKFLAPLDLSRSDHAAKTQWNKETVETARRLVSTPAGKTPASPLKMPQQIPTVQKVKLSPSTPSKLDLKAPPSLSSFCQGFFETLPIADSNTALNSLHNWIQGIIYNFPANGDPLEKNELFRLEKDLAAYRSQPIPKVYKTNQQQLQALGELLRKDEKAAKEHLEGLELEILALANRKPTSLKDKFMQRLARYGKKSKVLTLEELIISFGKGDSQEIMQRNSTLSAQEVKQLFNKIGNYLLQATHEQQRQRSLSNWNDLQQMIQQNASAENIELATQQLATTVLQERQYDPNLHPAYLAFEYSGDLLMHAQQIAKLDEFLTRGNLNPVLELIMGSGKSKVLLPLLGLLRANRKELSMLVVPESLFEEVASGTQKILAETFSQKMKTLHFDRNSTFTATRLHTILDELRYAVDNAHCLIMTSKSFKCLILKFIDKYDEYFKSQSDQPLPEELQVMREILILLKEQGYPIIDEAGSVLNVLHETSFSIGAKSPPNKTELNLIANIYTILYNDPTFKNLMRLESDPTPQSKAPPLTERHYFDSIQKPLANAVLQKLKTIDLGNDQLNLTIHTFMEALDGSEQTLLIDYLCRNPHGLAHAQSFYDTLSPEIQNILALVGEELCHLLPFTLIRKSDENYGLDADQGGIIAIPFSGAKKPNRGSQFANHYITINYTLQYYAKLGISPEIIESQIKRLQTLALQELQESKGLTLVQTEAWKHFTQFTSQNPMPLFKYKPSELEALVAAINANMPSKQAFILHTILPQLELFAEKLSCNSHNMIAFQNKVTGFEGALWNSMSMHRKLKPEPVAGTDAQTLNLLWKNSRNALIDIEAESAGDILQELRSKGVIYDLSADAGGYFREWTNETAAARIATLEGKPVVYFDKLGQLVETNGKEITPLTQSKTAPHARKTFLDQIHTTGADVKQKPTAIGLVTIDHKMLLRDLLQSVWRLRGLNKGQRITFLVSREVAAIMRQELELPKDKQLSFDDILHFTIRNQAKQQGKDNVKALKQELRSLSKEMALEILLNKNLSVKEQKGPFEQLRTTWFQPVAQEPRLTFGKAAIERAAPLVIAEERKTESKKFSDLFAAYPWLERKGWHQNAQLNEIETIIARLEKHLPLQIISPLADDDNTVEVENETQTEVSTELQVQQETHDKVEALGYIIGMLTPKSALDEKLFESKSLPYFPVSLYMQQEETLQPYAKAFEDIQLTLNVLQWPEQSPTLKSLKLFGSHRTPLHFVSIDEAGEIVILGQIDTPLYGGRRYHLLNGFSESGHEHFLTPQVKAKLAKIRFLNGDSAYSKEEIALLTPWLKQHDPLQMRKLFEEQILSGLPQRAIQYQDSSLQKLFRKIT